jgi:bifunctional DNA-binding transcriptional regulator/antitoxin component of YhaV-PrlF toxin-antitoxin module
MVLPKNVRQALGLQGDEKVLVLVEADEVRITSMKHAVGRAQELYRQHATVSRSTEDFLNDCTRSRRRRG